MNGKFRNWTSIFLALALIVAVISILFIVFFTCRSSAIMEQAGEIGNLLSAGLGIIGIAIAVWAALNITNAISRAEIEKAGKTVSALEQKIDPIDKFVQKNKGVQKELFLQEITKHKDDPIIGYFESQVGDSKKDDPYSELTIIELLFSRVKARHRSEYAVDFTLLSLAKDGIECINGLKKNLAILNSQKIICVIEKPDLNSIWVTVLKADRIVQEISSQLSKSIRSLQKILAFLSIKS